MKKELHRPGTDINIEGLAATPEGDLLIGFRAPLIDKMAPVLRLTNPAAVTERGEEPRFGKPHLLDLDERGIRSIDWTGLLPPVYLVLAGPAKGQGREIFALFLGRRRPPPVRASAQVPEGFHRRGARHLPRKRPRPDPQRRRQKGQERERVSQRRNAASAASTCRIDGPASSTSLSPFTLPSPRSGEGECGVSRLSHLPVQTGRSPAGRMRGAPQTKIHLDATARKAEHPRPLLPC